MSAAAHLKSQRRPVVTEVLAKRIPISPFLILVPARGGGGWCGGGGGGGVSSGIIG